MHVAESLRPRYAQRHTLPFEVQMRRTLEASRGKRLFEVPAVLDAEGPGSDGVPVLVVPRIEVEPLIPFEGLVGGIVNAFELVLTGKGLEMVTQLVGERFPQLVGQSKLGSSFAS